MSYYESCVRDSCGCDNGGDCECMCDTIAVYAKACLDAGVCIDWRTPDFCRKFLLLEKKNLNSKFPGGQLQSVCSLFRLLHSMSELKKEIEKCLV